MNATFDARVAVRREKELRENVRVKSKELTQLRENHEKWLETEGLTATTLEKENRIRSYETAAKLLAFTEEEQKYMETKQFLGRWAPKAFRDRFPNPTARPPSAQAPSRVRRTRSCTDIRPMDTPPQRADDAEGVHVDDLVLGGIGRNTSNEQVQSMTRNVELVVEKVENTCVKVNHGKSECDHSNVISQVKALRSVVLDVLARLDDIEQTLSGGEPRRQNNITTSSNSHNITPSYNSTQPAPKGNGNGTLHGITSAFSDFDSSEDENTRTTNTEEDAAERNEFVKAVEADAQRHGLGGNTSSNASANNIVVTSCVASPLGKSPHRVPVVSICDPPFEPLSTNGTKRDSSQPTSTVHHDDIQFESVTTGEDNKEARKHGNGNNSSSISNVDNNAEEHPPPPPNEQQGPPRRFSGLFFPNTYLKTQVK
eukprot:PhF_6_TR41740/c0_g1_i1/m.63348